MKSISRSPLLCSLLLGLGLTLLFYAAALVPQAYGEPHFKCEEVDNCAEGRCLLELGQAGQKICCKGPGDKAKLCVFELNSPGCDTVLPITEICENCYLDDCPQNPSNCGVLGGIPHKLALRVCGVVGT